MSQPLHLQDSLSKIPLLQKVHETLRAVPEAERDKFAQQLKRHEKNKSQKPQDAKEAEKNQIRERQNKKENKKQNRKFKRNVDDENEEQSEEQQLDAEESGQMIDIIV